MAETKAYGVSGISGNVELGKGGPRLKDDSGVIEARNTGDDDYAIMRGGSPIGDNDLVTKQYLEAYGAPVVIGNIYDSGGPASTQFTGSGQEGAIAICNETVAPFTENILYRLDTWDTDVDTSDWTPITPTEGMRISMTDASSGGSTAYTADHIYMWDEDGSTWIDMGPSAAVSKVVKTERVALVFGSSGTLAIGSAIPAGSRVHKVIINVTTAFDGTTPTATVGDSSDPDRLLTDPEVDLTAVGTYVADCYYAYGSNTQTNVTYVADSSTAGAAEVEVLFSIQ